MSWRSSRLRLILFGMQAHATFDLLNARDLAHALPLGVAIADLDGTLLFVNRELERITGHPQGSLLGESVDSLIPEARRSAHRAERMAYAQAPSERAMGAGRELFALRADGSLLPVEVGLHPVETTQGPAVLATIIDVSERRHLERGLKAVFEASPVGMLLCDPEGHMMQANPALCATFGYELSTLEGQPVEMLLPLRHRQAHPENRQSFLRDPTPRVMGAGRDLTGRRRDGVEIPVEVGLSSFMTPRGPATLAAVVDITERKRAEMQLRESNAQLEEFSYVTSHDLRSPIRGLLSLIDFILEDYGDEAPESVLKNLGRIQDRAKRMERLIEDLLVYARAGKRSLKVETVELQPLVQEILKLDPPPDHITVALDLNVPAFEGAATPLTTILRNLYSNAVKHHDRDEGRITFSAHAHEDMCVIDVTDDGPGIPKSAQARVFRLFQTLTASERQGSGLGLAVSRRLAEVHGARILLLSEDNERGCTFRVLWPRFMRSDLDD